MGQTSAGLTWLVMTHAGAWDDYYDEPYKHKQAPMDQAMARIL